MQMLNPVPASAPHRRSPRVGAVLSVLLGLILIGGGVEPRPAAAQSSPAADTTDDPERVGYVAVGSQYLSGIGSLNDALGAAGYSTTERTALSLGAGSYRVLGRRTMLGLEGQGVLGFEDEGGSRDSPIGAAYGFGNLGYQIVSTDRLRLYPLIGAGLGASIVNFEPNENKPEQQFEDVLNDPDRRSLIAQGALLVQGGIGFEVRFPLDLHGPMKGRVEQAVVGVRAGYVLDPATTDWSLSDGEDLEGGPDAAPSGPYLRLIIGGL